MPNIAGILKAEISRVARKEARGETGSLKKASSQYRSDIAALKRRVQALERQILRLGKVTAKDQAQDSPEESDKQTYRFSATRLATQRQKLGISAKDMAALLGVSALSVYKWEQGKARPRAKQIEAIASLRNIGKKEATARLDALTA